MTWAQLGVRLQAIAARIQRLAGEGDRVAILAPQGIDYVAGFYAAVKAGTIAVPLFAPELPGHAERLETALRDSEPTVVLTTAAAKGAVEDFLIHGTQLRTPHVVVIDQIPDSAGESFVPVELGVDRVSHLQYTSGSTRPPVGVEITHRAVGVNLTQMILSIDLLNRNTHGVSWLPLYHDMGLSMIGFPAVYGGHSTLMSPTAFVRRPQRWIQALSGGVEARQRRHRRAQLRLRVDGTARPARGGRRHRPEQCRADHRLRAGQHRRDRDVQQSVRPLRVAAHGIQALVRDRGGDAVDRNDRTQRRGEGRLPGPRTAGRGPRGACRRGCSQCRAPGVVRPDRSQSAGRDRQPRYGCRATRRRGRRSLVAGRQRWPGLLGTPRRNRAGIPRAAAIAAGDRAAAPKARRPTARGCGPATWASISTARSTSPAVSRIW